MARTSTPSVVSSIASLRDSLEQQQKRLLELESLRVEFKRSRFDRAGSVFDNDSMVGVLLGQFLAGLLDRRMLWKVLQEHQLAMSGVVDDSSISELGQILGVKIIISGAVLHFQNIIEVNARIKNGYRDRTVSHGIVPGGVGIDMRRSIDNV